MWRSCQSIIGEVKSQYGTLEESMSDKMPFQASLSHGFDDGVAKTKVPAIALVGDSDSSSSGEHCHKDRGNTIDQAARRKLITASVLCLIFMLGEIVGGLLSNSLAIATDAAHLLTDFASFMISLFSLYVSTRPATRRMSFGWYRAEVLGALTSVLLIWVVTAVLVYLAVLRIISDDYEINAEIMIISSTIGVIVNIIMGLTLHQHGHSHGNSHGHSHENSFDPENGLSHSHSSAQNINVRAAFIHVIGDFLQSVGVCIAAFIIYFKPEWRIVDPICTFLFSILVLMTTFAILKDTLRVLMEATPKGMEFTDVLDILHRTDGVLRVHNVRIWALSMDKVALCAHVVMKPGEQSDRVLRNAENNIRKRYKVFELTLQVEPFVESMDVCDQCVCP
ncbi:Hypothetical predicted protein [Cloeon dipterum]|uniref:Cation efflux protein cytoplasmic domain-containing protein n=1 Tax=Cloeon dipterum TaxID=197152 RepID=A0A8S1BUH1_9INSE|nr:Hypothetical predicted protein [Cloeon dipterum]